MGTVRSFRGRRVVVRPPAAQMRLPSTVLARPRRVRSRWEPGIPLYPVPARDPELEAELAWWGYHYADTEPGPDSDGEAGDDAARWEPREAVDAGPRP